MLHRSLLGKNLPVNMLLRANGASYAIPQRLSNAGLRMFDASSPKFPEENSGKFVMAGSPLFVTDLSKQFDFSEIQFVLSEQVCDDTQSHFMF
jgi:hypothetical protein